MMLRDFPKSIEPMKGMDGLNSRPSYLRLKCLCQDLTGLNIKVKQCTQLQEHPGETCGGFHALVSNSPSYPVILSS